MSKSGVRLPPDGDPQIGFQLCQVVDPADVIAGEAKETQPLKPKTTSIFLPRHLSRRWTFGKFGL